MISLNRPIKEHVKIKNEENNAAMEGKTNSGELCSYI